MFRPEFFPDTPHWSPKTPAVVGQTHKLGPWTVELRHIPSGEWPRVCGTVAGCFPLALGCA